MARRPQNTKGNWGEFILFVLVILCIYLMLALFDSSLVGEGGRGWGKYLRSHWGGAVIVILLFWLYLCVAKFLKLRIPRLPRQVLGTVQLYISFAFMLGFLKETGWNSEMTLFLPGDFGSGLAKFFVLNIGTFITLILIAASFLLSAFFFGAKVLKLTLPEVSSLKLRRRRPRRQSRQNRYTDDETPEDILFTKKIPEPVFSSPDYDSDSAQIFGLETPDTQSRPAVNFQMPKLKPAPEDSVPIKKPPEGLGAAGQNTIEKIDDALALLGSIDSQQRKKSKPAQTQRTRKLRRPLPELVFPDSEGSDEPETQKRRVQTAEFKPKNDESVFPPPAEIFGERARFDASRNIQRETSKQSRIITNTLKNFDISASVAQVVAGPSITQYKLEIGSGVKVSKVSGLDEELAMDLAVMSVRIEAPILGTHYVGIEVPASDRKIVSLRSVIESGDYINTSARLPVPLGVKTGGRILVRGLEEMPHVLIAGADGSGRRTFVNSCIMSLCALRRPEEFRVILIDTGHMEFAAYEGLPHLLAGTVNDVKTARKALEWACTEMDRRTAEFAAEKARNIEAYNRKVQKGKRIPEVAIVISELSDLMYADAGVFSELIVKLARKSGTAGIYTLIAAQKPSADVFTSQMKSLIPARAVFALSSPNDSRNVIDSQDAAKLTGKGDMLFMSTSNPVPVRLQTPYVSEDKISEFTDYMKDNLEPPEFVKF